MIYKSYLVEKDSNLLKQSRHFLIYGENIGLIDRFVKVLKDTNRDSEISIFFQSDIINNKDLLINEILNKSLFTKKKIFFIKEVSDKIYNTLKDAVSKAGEDINIFILCGMLDKKSKIRALFEKDKNLGTIACYKDSEITLSYYLDKELTGYKNLSNELKMYIIKECKLDRKKIEQIINKIKIFFLDKIIDKNKVNFLIDSNYDDDLEELRDVSISGMNKELNKLLGEVRIDIENNNYIINLLITKLLKLKNLIEIKGQGISSKQAVDQFKPPIFWKEKESYYKLLELWDVKKINTALKHTQKAELDIRKSAIRKDLVIKHLLIYLCKKASSPSLAR
tara:strand:+ start:929 stop:1939 length:1011 start_codon:yes stop_codon:yes gene_type:complete